MKNKYSFQGIQGTIIWFIATLFVVYSFSLNTAAAVFSDAIKNSLQASNAGVSLATGAFIVGFALMQIPAGYLLDKFNARFIVSSGILLLALGNIASSFSDTLALFMLANFAQGIGASFAFIAAAILISQWFQAKFFPILFGVTQTISCIFSAILHYYFIVILTTHSWQYIYRLLSFFGIVLFILSFLFIKSPSNLKQQSNFSIFQSLKTVFQSREIILCAIAGATSFGVLLAYASYWYMSIEKFYAVETLEAVTVSGAIFVGIGVGTPLMGWISNKLKSRVMVIHTALVLGTMALLLGIYLPHFALNSLILAKIIAFLTGLLLSGSMLFYTIVSEASSSRYRGVAMSVLNTSVFLFNSFMLFFPLLFITDLSKDFFTHLWTLPFFILFSILLLYFIKDSYIIQSKT